MIEQLTHAIRGGQYTGPKTILGFLGAVYLLAVSFALGTIVALASSGKVIWLIPVILLLVVVGTVALIWAVLKLAGKDPTPLVLGQISGGDYIAHKQLLKRGDSAAGELLEVPENLLRGLPENAEEDRVGGETDGGSEKET